MAPPGVNSFYDHLDSIMTFGSCFSPFSSSYTSSLMSPLSLKPALSPLSSRSFSYGLSVIHSDHDYVIKPAAPESAQFADDATASDITTSPDGSNSACVDEGSCQAPGSDAMLSSAADLDSTGDDNIADTDFLPDLDSIDFSLTDLDPCSDMAMEDSFQEFIDSALDKSSATFYGNDEEAAVMKPETGAVIYNKEDFFHMLGLRPTGQVTTATPTSCSTQTLEAVPTKKTSCSGTEASTSTVYSTAYNRQHHAVQTSPSTQGVRRNYAPSSSPHVLLIPSSLELMTPLTIDTSFDISLECPRELSPQGDDVTMAENSGETCDDSDTNEFLKWLHDANEIKTNDDNNNEINLGGLMASSTVTGNYSQRAVESELDLESFIDLDDYITDSTTPYPEVTSMAPSISDGLVAHRKYQKAVSDLKLSLLTEFSFRFTENERQKNDAVSDYSTVPTQRCNSSRTSPAVPHSKHSLGYKTWPSSVSGSPFHSPLSARSTDISSVSPLDDHDRTHLSMLDLFSEENAPSLLHIEMSDQDIGFM